MTQIEEGLGAFLAADATLTGLVSTRIYSMRMPQTPTLPAVVFYRISNRRELVQNGDAGYARTRFQIDCWGSTYSSVKGVADAVRQRMQAYSGTMSGLTVQRVAHLNDNDVFEEDTEIFGVSMDFEIWHLET